MKYTNLGLPVGPPIPDLPPALVPAKHTYSGRHVKIRPVDPGTDAADLHPISNGGVDKDRIWTYLGYGPFGSASEMESWLRERAASQDPIFLTVVLQETNRPVGMASFMRIVPAWRRLELGHIWYAPEVQRTAVNTETVYLMLKESFDNLHYRRVEWKCDSLNARSRAAALRLGFQFEGIFRQHMIYKNRSRDTAWFAMLDSGWPEARDRLEDWLYGNQNGGKLQRPNPG